MIIQAKWKEMKIIVVKSVGVAFDLKQQLALVREPSLRCDADTCKEGSKSVNVVGIGARRHQHDKL